MWITVTSAHPSQCLYFAAASKECYAPRLKTMVTCVDGQANIHTVFKLHSWVEWCSITDRTLEVCQHILLCGSFWTHLHKVLRFSQSWWSDWKCWCGDSWRWIISRVLIIVEVVSMLREVVSTWFQVLATNEKFLIFPLESGVRTERTCC